MTVYAVKTVRKSRLLGQSAVGICERNLLHTVPEFPFLTNLAFVFQTPGKFYLGFDYAAGGLLIDHIRSMPVLAMDDLRLYLAEIVLALEHLHRHGIVFRNLTPDNVVLSDAEQGHIRLVDFGLSRPVVVGGREVCGAAEYLAPEVIAGGECGPKIDWWALGVLFYELVFADQPFYDDSNDALFAQIAAREPEYPEFRHIMGTDLLKRLLVKNPAERIGDTEIRAHPFFEGLDWGKVTKLEINPRTLAEIMNDLGANSSSNATEETTESGSHSPDVNTPFHVIHPGLQGVAPLHDPGSASDHD
jgi:serine/threonine protein kinase